MQPDKKIWFSERETEATTLTREQLLNEIRRVTDLDAPVKQKILEIRYLIKHYFIIGENEELPDTYWPDECAPDGTCIPENERGALTLNNKVELKAKDNI